MANDNLQKLKLLVLYDILCRFTDENNAMNTDELIEELAKRNISVARKVLPLDIALLNENGYEVRSYKKKYHYYYVASRTFDTAEVKMLSDIVKASKLHSSKKQRLINKIAQTMSKHQAARVLSNVISLDSPKRNNTNILHNIDAIDRAINARKKVSFRYFLLDDKKERIYRKDGGRYVTNPIVMVWDKDNYYLIAYPDNHSSTTTYRIDRMEDVEIEDTPIVNKEEFADFDVEKYRTQVFSMFGGELKEVELQFIPEMLNDIYDKFGEDIAIETTGEKYKVTAQIQISPTFFSWVVGSRGKVRIITPPDVCEQFKAFVDTIKKEY